MILYKLGHCQELAIAELNNLIKLSNIGKNYVFSTQEINVNVTGSIIYSFKVINELEIGYSLNDLNFEGLEKKSGFFSISETPFNRVQIIKKLKEFGSKKVNCINEEPNFGHYKGCKNWYGVIYEDGKIYFGKIISYSNQEFWSELDYAMPGRDMKRGIINLKLARSMANLVKSKKNTLIDPFCGTGRVLIANFDKFEKGYASDIDTEAQADYDANIDFSKKYWGRNSRYIDSNMIMETDFETIEASKRSYKTPDAVVISEGTLGSNFKKKYNYTEAASQLTEVANVWRDVVQVAYNNNIQELVFSLPYYPQDLDMDKNQHLIDNSLKALNNRLYNTALPIYYSRKNSVVGHCIIHLTLN